MKKAFGVIRKIVYAILLVFLLVTAMVVAMSAFDIPTGTKLYTVLTGSMTPAIPAGSIVVVKPSTDYKKGDVITFKSESDKNPKPIHTTTHRIIAIKETEQGPRFETKGDYNSGADSILVSSQQILGRVIFHIPFVGYPVGFAKTQTGFVILIVIPATILIYSELMAIKDETRKLLKARKERKLSAREKIEVAIGKEEIAVEKAVKKIFKTPQKK